MADYWNTTTILETVTPQTLAAALWDQLDVDRFDLLFHSYLDPTMGYGSSAENMVTTSPDTSHFTLSLSLIHSLAHTSCSSSLTRAHSLTTI